MFNDFSMLLLESLEGLRKGIVISRPMVVRASAEGRLQVRGYDFKKLSILVVILCDTEAKARSGSRRRGIVQRTIGLIMATKIQAVRDGINPKGGS